MPSSSLSCACSTAQRARAAIEAGLRSDRVPAYKKAMLLELEAQLVPWEAALRHEQDLGFVFLALPFLGQILTAALAIAGVAVIGVMAYDAVQIERKLGEKVADVTAAASEVTFFGLAGVAVVAAAFWLSGSGRKKAVR